MIATQIAKRSLAALLRADRIIHHTCDSRRETVRVVVVYQHATIVNWQPGGRSPQGHHGDPSGKGIEQLHW